MKSPSSFGAYGELFVCNYFINLGLEVFRNITPSGPVDIVIYNAETQKLLLLDVKSTRTVYIRADGAESFPNGPKLRSDGVWQILYVHGDASIRLPDGFWQALGMETAE